VSFIHCTVSCSYAGSAVNKGVDSRQVFGDKHIDFIQEKPVALAVRSKQRHQLHHKLRLSVLRGSVFVGNDSTNKLVVVQPRLTAGLGGRCFDLCSHRPEYRTFASTARADEPHH
jgi:hypothetical protein